MNTQKGFTLIELMIVVESSPSWQRSGQSYFSLTSFVPS